MMLYKLLGLISGGLVAADEGICGWTMPEFRIQFVTVRIQCKWGAGVPMGGQ